MKKHFTVVLFVFQLYLACNLGKFIDLELGTVSEKVGQDSIEIHSDIKDKVEVVDRSHLKEIG